MALFGRGRDREDDRDLATFVYEDPLNTGGLGAVWFFNFVNMALVVDTERSYEAERSVFRLRRKDGPIWEAKMIPESAVAHGFDPVDARWEEVPDEIAAQVEPHYQRFLLHWRR